MPVMPPDGQPPVDVRALGGVCDWRWVEVLATDLPDPKAPAGCPIPNGTVQAATGAHLDQGSADGVMDDLNWGYIQLGLVALAFGGLQVWWIRSTLGKRDLARPLSEEEFKRSLERIWR